MRCILYSPGEYLIYDDESAIAVNEYRFDVMGISRTEDRALSEEEIFDKISNLKELPIEDGELDENISELLNNITVHHPRMKYKIEADKSAKEIYKEKTSEQRKGKRDRELKKEEQKKTVPVPKKSIWDGLFGKKAPKNPKDLERLKKVDEAFKKDKTLMKRMKDSIDSGKVSVTDLKDLNKLLLDDPSWFKVMNLPTLDTVDSKSKGIKKSKTKPEGNPEDLVLVSKLSDVKSVNADEYDIESEALANDILTFLNQNGIKESGILDVWVEEDIKKEGDREVVIVARKAGILYKIASVLGIPGSGMGKFE